MAKYPREHKTYTYEELTILEEMVGAYSFPSIGRKVGRSPDAVKRQLERMGISSTKLSGGVLSANELAKALHVHARVLNRLREVHKLPLKPQNLRYGNDKHISWHINPDSFWRWAGKNQDLINWTRYEPESIIPEPGWLREKIREQRETIPARTRRVYTDEEDKRIWAMYYRGTSQREIAEVMGRSESSVEKRLMRLRKKLKGERE